MEDDKFVTYENRNNPHVTIHCFNCNQIAKRGGIHKKNSRGKYEHHRSYEEAKQYAMTTELPIKECSFCNAPNCA